MQLWHGTEDATLDYVNFGEGIEQWTNAWTPAPIASLTITNTGTTPVNDWSLSRIVLDGLIPDGAALPRRAAPPVDVPPDNGGGAFSAVCGKPCGNPVENLLLNGSVRGYPFFIRAETTVW